MIKAHVLKQIVIIFTEAALVEERALQVLTQLVVLEQLLLVGIVSHQAVDICIDLKWRHHAQDVEQIFFGLAYLVEDYDVLNEVEVKEGEFVDFPLVAYLKEEDSLTIVKVEAVDGVNS